MAILILVVVVFVVFLILQRYRESIQQQEHKRKKLVDEQLQKNKELVASFDAFLKKRTQQAYQNREKITYNETITIVYESVNENGKPIGIAKRANGTYASIERENHRFKISEEIRIATSTINQWNWYNETKFRSVLAIKLKEEAIRQQELEKRIKQAEYLDKFRIEYLYHMTHKSNLPNILQNGLLSHNQARNSQLTQVDIADNQVNNRRTKLEPIYQRSIHDYVPLYFNPKNPMLYRRGNIQNDIVILAIDRNLLYQPNVIFTNGNAAASTTSFFSNPSDLINLNWNCINADYWNDIVDGKRIRCSETLVFPNIPTSAIKKVFCNNQQTKNFVENSLTNNNTIDIEIKANLYFNNFVQNNHPSINNTTYGTFDDLPF